MPSKDSPRRVYQVSELTRWIKAVLSEKVGAVWIEGECSNTKDHSSGHLYFTLKDATGQIRAAMFRDDRANLAFPVKDGMKLRVYGLVTIYAPSSNYQVIVQRIEDAGIGSLQEAFEKLKAKLKAEGLFEASAKKPLPVLPRRIGIVTSPTGAAIHDMLQVLKRRYPNLHVLIAPVPVQGEGAATRIANAVDHFSQTRSVDVIIVGRGGGSLEDLQAFNEEVLARALAACELPVISGVGHEVDFTICDFVADLRAATPSAAAELVIRPKAEFEDRIDGQRRRLIRALDTRRLELKNRFVSASRSYVFREPHNLLLRYRQQVDGLRGQLRQALRGSSGAEREHLKRLKLRLGHEATGRLREVQHRLDDAQSGLLREAERCVKERRQRVAQFEKQLRALNPYQVLERGFSITHAADGSVVKQAADVSKGDRLRTRLGQGEIDSIAE